MLAGREDFVEKKLMGGLAFMLAGGMCCSVSGKGGLLVRVDAGIRQELLQEPHVQPMEMGGRTMSGFLRVAPEGYKTDAALRKWLQRGIDGLAAKPAKPAGRKRSRKAASVGEMAATRESRRP